MAGQPLAWMEASNLPEEAYGLSEDIEAYRSVMEDFHSGIILPIGGEPSGRSWTGFQSMTDGTSGYVLVFREDNEDESACVDTWFGEGTEVKFEKICGDGSPFAAVVGDDGAVEFSLAERNTFVLYRYKVL